MICKVQFTLRKSVNDIMLQSIIVWLQAQARTMIKLKINVTKKLEN